MCGLYIIYVSVFSVLMHFQNIGIRSGIYFRKIGINWGIHFGKICIRDRHLFEALMARPRPKLVYRNLKHNVL